MYCLECNDLIIKKITIDNIFKTNINKICNTCFSKYLFIQGFETLPIENGLIYLNTLFDNYKNPFSLMSFLKPYYIYTLKNQSFDLILYFNTFNKDVYHLVDKLNFGNIFVITLKNDMKKEKNYED